MKINPTECSNKFKYMKKRCKGIEMPCEYMSYEWKQFYVFVGSGCVGKLK